MNRTTPSILLLDPDPTPLEAHRQMLALAPTLAPGLAPAIHTACSLSELPETQPGVILSSLPLTQLPDLLAAFPGALHILLAAPEDLSLALAALNHYNLFRLLATPVAPYDLIHAVTAALDHAAQLRRQQDLLDHTLTGSIRLLNDVLSAAGPEAFGRSLRIARTMDFLLTRFSLPEPWRFHVAATLSQLGCVTIDSEIVQKAYAGSPLTPAEQARFDSHPQRSQEILSHVPGLEPVAWIIGQQLKHDIPPLTALLADVPTLTEAEAAPVHLGARILKLAAAYESLCVTLVSEDYVMVRLQNRAAEFGPELVEALTHAGPREVMTELRRLPMARLKAGMVLDQEIRSRQGLLVVAKGQEVTRALLFRLENFARTGLAEREVMARITI